MGLFKNRKKQRTATEAAAQAAPVYVEQAEFDNLVAFLNTIITANHNALAADFYELRDELATNGVVRDLRKAQKEILQLRGIIENVDQRVVEKFKELHTNGVATAINKLNAEVFKDRKAKRFSNEEGGYDLVGLMMSHFGANKGEAPQEATLLGKVDAIVEHLGLDLDVQPEEVKKAKVVAKRKPVTKKKGRR